VVRVKTIDGSDRSWLHKPYGRKWLLLAAVIGLGLAGCSSSSTSGGGSANSGSSVAAASSGPASGGSAGSSPSSRGGSATASGSATDWNTVVDAANQEGEVVVYTHYAVDQADAMIAAFNKVYPNIKVQLVTDATATLPARYEQERQSTGKSPADVLMSGVFEPLITQYPDWFIPVTAAALPNASQFSNAAFRSGRPLSVIVGAYVWEIVYNTDLVKSTDVPKTWADLLSSQWKGKILAVDPRASESYMAIWDVLRTKLDPSTFQSLAHAGFAISESASDVAQKVASGADAIGLFTNQNKVGPLVSKGAPIKTVEFAPYLLGSTTMSFPTDAPHPNAAKVFGNFMLSQQLQVQKCGIAYEGSFNTGAQGGDCSSYAIPTGSIALPFAVSSSDQAAVLSALGLKAQGG
jgi:iron(III) transport system substrate-binding protein